MNITYEGVSYRVVIENVFVFPQCFAAVAPRLSNMTEANYIVVDMGSKTVDALTIKNGVPIETKSTTIELGLVKLMRMLEDGLQSQFGKKYPLEEIEKALFREENRLEADVVQKISEIAKSYVASVEAELTEREFDLDYTNVLFLGGGAKLVRYYTKHASKNYSYDDNICCNAQGFEFLTQMQLGEDNE